MWQLAGGGPNERLQTGVDQRTTGTTTDRGREAASGDSGDDRRHAVGGVSASGLTKELDDAGVEPVSAFGVFLSLLGALATALVEHGPSA